MPKEGNKIKTLVEYKVNIKNIKFIIPGFTFISDY